MAINKKLIHFENKQNFDNEVANGNILNHSIVFIQDSKEISTHGTVYKTVNWSILVKLYEWVDLGLPSGLKWSAWNVGAEKPEDFGLYFAWGETEGQSGITENKRFYWGDYKFHTNQSNPTSGTFEGVTKYNNDSSYGTVDNLTVLEQVDDAAYQSDNSCRIPTKADFEELINNTTSVWETLNGVNGRRFTSKTNGNSIFVPAAGYCNFSSVNNIDSYCQLWSSSVKESNARSKGISWGVYCKSDNMALTYYNRCFGLSIRPVKD